MIRRENQITIDQLFDSQKENLGLQWVAGQQGKQRVILPEQKSASSKNRLENKSIVGYLNLIHPQQIQILGDTELDYLKKLQDISRQDAIQQLLKHKPACFIVADNKNVPVFLKRKCNENSIPLFSSPMPSSKMTDRLRYYLYNLFAEVISLHGVYMEIYAIGVLITGPSGIGKSELALELVTRGHRLVADDAPQFSRIAPDIIKGSCPPILQDFLEVRGLGVINVRALFGDSAVKENKYLRLIITLQPKTTTSIKKIDRFSGSYRTRNVLDIDMPEITLPVAPGRNLAALMECATRNHMLYMSGYNAPEEFAKRQQKFIAEQK